MPLPSVPALWRRLRSSVAARGAGTALVSRVAGAALGLGVHLVLARWGGPSTYGTYSVAVAWVTTLAIAAGAGFPEAALRFVPTYEVDGAWDRVRGLLHRSERLILALALGAALLGSAGLWAVTRLSSPSTQAIAVGLWALPFVALVRFYTEACRSVDRLLAAYVAPRLVRPGLLFLGVAAAAGLSSVPLTGPVVTAVFGASFVPVVLLQRTSFRRYVAGHNGLTGNRQYETRRWTRVALPLLLVTGFVMLLQKLDLLLVGWMMGMADAGLYQAAVTVASPVSFILGAVNAVAAPRFARFHTAGDAEAFRHFVHRLAHWLFWPALGLGLLLAGGATTFLGVLGAEYVAARIPLYLLVFSHLVNAGAGSVGYLLNMTGHHLDSARVYGMTTGLHLFLTAAGIQLFGLAGAAAATALAMLVWNVWLHVLVKKRLGFAPSITAALLASADTPEDASDETSSP